MTSYGIEEEIDSDNLFFDLPELLVPGEIINNLNEERYLANNNIDDQTRQSISTDIIESIASSEVSSALEVYMVQPATVSPVANSTTIQANPEPTRVDVNRRRAARKKNNETNNKEEPIVILDNEKESPSAIIDLTKETDDIEIISETPNSRGSRLTLDESIVPLEPLPSNTEPVTSFSLSTANQIAEIETIQNASANNVLAISFSRTRGQRLIRQQRREIANSTIIIDDERPPPSNTIPSTNQIQPTIGFSSIDNQIQMRLELFQNFDFESLVKRPRIEPVVNNSYELNSATSGGVQIPSNSHLNVVGISGIQIPAPVPMQSTRPVGTSSSSLSVIQCPICLETLDELKSHNKRLKSTTCGHILCNECLDATYKSTSGPSSSKTILCPTCRQKLGKNKIHDLFL